MEFVDSIPHAFGTVGAAAILRRLVIHPTPTDATSMRPSVPGSGVGAAAEAENVPLTNATVELPFWSFAGAKLRTQLPLVGIVMRNSLNVGPDPMNPMAIGFNPPATSKKEGLDTPISVLGL